MRIVVLGGAGIVGRVIALDLAEDDLELVIADRDLAGAQRTASDLGKKAVAVEVDVTDTGPPWSISCEAPGRASTAPSTTSTWT